MTRLIDAEQFGVISLQGKSEEFIEGVKFMFDKIHEAPTVERPHGEWKFIGDNLFKCTHCGYIADACYLRKWKVHTYDAEFPTACLKCGADMREGDRNET